MADITDIKAILYTDKTFKLQENNVVTVKTSTRITKNSLKEIFKTYFDITPLKVNSLRQSGKEKDLEVLKVSKLILKNSMFGCQAVLKLKG